MRPALLAAAWPAPPNIRAFTTLRSGPGVPSFNLGLRSGDEAAAARANRAALQALLGASRPPLWLHQVHGATVVRAEDDMGAGEPSADAAITALVGQPLAILSADCLPVLFCADDGSEIGAAHAGWRGLAGGVLEATVAAMSTPAGRLLAWLGPCAGPAAYEVGEDVHAAFVDADAAADSAFEPTRPGHWRVDLPALARRRLGAVGVQRVFGGGECTISDAARYFSHRRDRVTGRMASVILIEAAAPT